MNYIVFKGVKSTDIDGLLICELPPISKPAMRVEETVINGKDGSIYEDLGYSAYEKTVTIGLHGKYDIDRVIKYFSGEGEVVFSNEPDKAYDAKIFSKIDYTRLLRYRQATISFTVQPYKHKRFETITEVKNQPAEVFNEGSEPSRPIMTIKGSGMIILSLNYEWICTYKFPDGENEVIIDSEKEEAHLNGTLKNRNMNGEFPILQPGTNIIEGIGDVESISVLPRSRWL